MGEEIILELLTNTISTMIKIVTPILGIAMVVGVAIALFQATTQINEQTMVFVPKIMAVFTGLMLLGSWMLTQLKEFTVTLFESILSLI